MILASSVEAAQKIVGPLALKDHALSFALGQEIEREELLEKLVSAGYEGWTRWSAAAILQCAATL